MKKFTIVLVFLIAQLSFAQIGIGNTNPQSTLDISTSNATSPSNTDGILIPRIDNFPATNPTAAQDGMMVFYTGTTMSGKGFYYWNQTTTSWVFMSGAKRIDDLVDGNSPDVTSLFLGTGAGLNDDGTGNRNVGIGQDALREIVDASNNVALGHFALKNSTIGSNTAVGSYALEYNDTGFRNTALGTFALRSNISGIDNVAVGDGALFFNTNNYNTAIGAAALYNNSTGVNNVAIGYYANRLNEEGNNNVSIGRGAGNNNVIGSGNINIGVNAGFNELGDNKLYIENTAANENNALIYGEFDNKILRTNGELQIGNPSGIGYALPLLDGSIGQMMTTDGAGQISFTTISATDTQNTLDQAYDEGGAGAGRVIDASDGTVTISGLDGLLVTGTANAGASFDPGGGVKMYFSPRTAAFRAGITNADEWNSSNVGLGSVAFGNSTIASGDGSFSAGGGHLNTGDYSVSFGDRNRVYAYAETAIGLFNTTEIPADGTVSNLSDRLFSIGNGTNNVNRSNAFTVFKNGEVTINDAYTLPVNDGAANQVLTTDGSGQVNFVDASAIFTSTQNTLDEAYDEGGAGVGRTITASNGAVLINGTDGFQNTGTFNSGATLALVGAGTKMFFYPRKSAFRAGYVNGNQWNDANIGNYSVALGNNPIASNSFAVALGRDASASGASSVALGWNGLASGGSSIAINYLANASGEYSMALGRESIASADYATAIGYTADASNQNSVAIGFNTVSSGIGSVAIGQTTSASGYRSLATGYANNAFGDYSTSMGRNTIAYSAYETSIGTFSTIYTPLSATAFNAADRLFVLGNGANSSNRSNALTIYKNGLMNINDEYNMPLTDGTANQVMATDGTGNVTFQTIAGDGNTQNTLDQAYDEGGAGTGRTITADNGAVLINGTEGFQTTGTFGSGSTLALSGSGSKMFFYPRKAAFRAGYINSTQWNDSNIGDYSTALGENTRASGESSTAMGSYASASGENSTAIGAGARASGHSATAFGSTTEASGDYSTAMGWTTDASGYYSTAMGDHTIASGNNSTAMGHNTLAVGGDSSSMGFSTYARSYAETAMGIYNTYYTPTSPLSTYTYYANDRLFVIGNGTSSSLRSNALTIYKSGLMNINDQYNMPLTDGAANQVMTTDGAGNVSFSTIISENTTANNGLTETGDNIQLGGELIQTTYITQNNNDMVFNLNGTGDFRIIEDGSTTKFVVLDNGDTVLGGDLYMRDEDTGGTVLGRLIDLNGDDGALDLYNSGTLSTRINGGGDSYLTGGNLGLGTATPDYNLSVSGTLNLREDIAGGGTALRVNGTEALWFDGNLFSWGFGGTANFFNDDVGIGINAPAYKLDVREANAGDYIAQIFNTSTNANADGLKIRVGNTAVPTASTSYVAFFDGNNTVRGRIQGNGTGVTYNTVSDRRLKTNIDNIDDALQLIDKIQPRRYEYKTNLGIKEYGFIAQELQPLYPQAVSGTADSDVETNPMMVDYSRLTPLLTAGLKELKKEVDILKTENAILKAKLNQLESLEARLSALENNTKKVPEAILASKN